MSDGCLLVDVDSVRPNLALMHVSAWKKAEGMRVGFDVPDPEEVYISCVFRENRSKALGIARMYPDAKVDVGGSGVDLSKTLPPEVDRMMPDYSLYGIDYDLGFTSRGCDRECPFCIVTPKEGRFHRYQHPSEFHDRGHRKAMWLDNNVLLDKPWFYEVTEWAMAEGVSVSFNQGLDLRLVDAGVAERVASLRTMECWHFAFDSMSYRDHVERGLALLRDAGLNLRGCLVYVYIRDDSQFEDALARCNILRDMGTVPYLMRDRAGRPFSKRVIDLARWCHPQIVFGCTFDEYRRGVHA